MRLKSWCGGTTASKYNENIENWGTQLPQSVIKILRIKSALNIRLHKPNLRTSVKTNVPVNCFGRLIFPPSIFVIQNNRPFNFTLVTVSTKTSVWTNVQTIWQISFLSRIFLQNTCFFGNISFDWISIKEKCFFQFNLNRPNKF